MASWEIPEQWKLTSLGKSSINEAFSSQPCLNIISPIRLPIIDVCWGNQLIIVGYNPLTVLISVTQLINGYNQQMVINPIIPLIKIPLISHQYPTNTPLISH